MLTTAADRLTLVRGLVRQAAPLALVVGLSSCLKSPAGPSAADGALGISFTTKQVAQTGEAIFALAIPTWAQGNGPLVISLSGAITLSDTLPLPSDPKGTPVLGAFTPPAGTPDGDVTITVSIPTFGTSASASIVVKDDVPPVLVSDTLSGSAGGHSFHDLASAPNLTLIPGMIDTLTLTVTDNHQLHSAGFALQGPAAFGDSAVLSGDSTALTIPFAVPATLAGDSAVFTTFVTDADGNRQTTSATVHVATAATKSTRVRSAASAPFATRIQKRPAAKAASSDVVIRLPGRAIRAPSHPST